MLTFSASVSAKEPRNKRKRNTVTRVNTSYQEDVAGPRSSTNTTQSSTDNIEKHDLVEFKELGAYKLAGTALGLALGSSFTVFTGINIRDNAVRRHFPSLFEKQENLLIKLDELAEIIEQKSKIENGILNAQEGWTQTIKETTRVYDFNTKAFQNRVSYSYVDHPPNPTNEKQLQDKLVQLETKLIEARTIAESANVELASVDEVLKRIRKGKQALLPDDFKYLTGEIDMYARSHRLSKAFRGPAIVLAASSIGLAGWGMFAPDHLAVTAIKSPMIRSFVKDDYSGLHQEVTKQIAR